MRKSLILEHNSRLNSYLCIKWPNSIICEYLIVYKSQNDISVQETINQIFRSKYYEKLKRSNRLNDLFIIGVGFNQYYESHFFLKVLTKKYKRNELPIENQNSWEELSNFV